MFLDDLLTSYQGIETRFAKHLYQVYKSFEFRSLWDVSDRLAEFQRRASEAAKGTGNLQGVLELTKALLEIDKIEIRVQKCFSRIHYATSTHKWHFDMNNAKHKTVCKNALYLNSFRKRNVHYAFRPSPSSQV